MAYDNHCIVIMAAWHENHYCIVCMPPMAWMPIMAYDTIYTMTYKSHVIV